MPPEPDLTPDELAQWVQETLNRVQETLNSEAFSTALGEALERIAEEENILEEAPWFGHTGLPETWERELPRYLRRELGESLLEEGALQAADLVYLGQVAVGASSIHYWQFHLWGEEEPTYAYIETTSSGEGIMGWGDRPPPSSLTDKSAFPNPQITPDYGESSP